MSSNNPIVRAGADSDRLAAPGSARGDRAGQTDIYRVALRALRGRYALAIALGMMTAVVGGIVGWRKGTPLYRSEGLIHVAYQRTTIEPDSQYRPWESFQAYLQSQQAFLSSRRVLDQATKEPEWTATGQGASPQVAGQFADGLKVEFKSNTEDLRVSFVDKDATIAAAAVNSIINAYVNLYRGQNDQTYREKLSALEERRGQVATRLENVRTRIGQIALKVGTTDVAQLYDAAIRRFAELEHTLSDFRLALLLAQGGQMPTTLSEQQIAAFDPLMREYLATRDRLEGEVARLKARQYGPKHPLLVQAQVDLQAAQNRVEKYAVDFRSLRAAMAHTPTAGADGRSGALALAGQPIESLRSQEAVVAGMYERARQEMMALGTQRLQLDPLKAEAAGIEKDLEELDHRIAMQRLESAIGGQVSVISRGEAPIAPFQDRRLPFAMAGAIGAGCVPAALLLLLGLANTRYRYSDETEADLAAHTPLLGILPLLPEGLIDPERAAEAAQCVHQIRAMLQIRSPRDRRPVYLASSASPGEGKTSLIAALGLSFAASGSRTLVVDFDLVGQRLTQEFEGEKLTGVHEALRTGEVAGFIKTTSTDGLWILPVGQADMLHASALSVAALERLLADARRHFDVVLIDSGPIMGSIEASLIAPQVDGVIFTIARGQQRPLVEKAVRHLSAIGARLAGMVFNRAEPADFHQSVHTTSLRSVSGRLVVSRGGGSDPDQSSKHGPVARSVASFLPQISGGEGDPS